MHQSHSIESLALNKKYPLKTVLSTIANTVENFRVNLDNILIKIGNTRTMKNAIKKFYANLLDIQSYLTQLYYCYATIHSFYLQQTVQSTDQSDESILGIKRVMNFLLTYLKNNGKKDSLSLTVLELNKDNLLGELYNNGKLQYRGYFNTNTPNGYGISDSYTTPLGFGISYFDNSVSGRDIKEMAMEDCSIRIKY